MWLASIVATAWLTRHAVSDDGRLSGLLQNIVLAASGSGPFPAAVVELRQLAEPTPINLVVNRKTVERPYWKRTFPSALDSGYLLFSGLDSKQNQAIVKLLRIADGAEIARWIPDWHKIYLHITNKKFAAKGSPRSANALHPLLLPNGDIVFNTLNALVRQSPCAIGPEWVINEVLHHSNELDDEGTIWTPSVSHDGLPENAWMQDRIRDDGISRISPDGRILERHSFIRMARNSGLEALLFGTGGGRFFADPIHLNEAKPAPSDTKYWRKGDLLLSSRHLSTLFLYRPSTQKVIWHRTGPWMAQHSPDFVDDHRISVFDNNIYSGSPHEFAFLSKEDINRVFVYDFETNETTQPFVKLLEEARPATVTDGRARVLPDGGLFLEETTSGRILRFTTDRLLWSLVNDYDDKRIGVVSWSRYLTAEEAEPVIRALTARQCQKR